MIRNRLSTRNFSASTQCRSAVAVKAGIILKRNPVVIRQPNAFETEYAKMRISRINEAATRYVPSFFETQKGMKKNDSAGEDSKMDYLSRNDDHLKGVSEDEIARRLDKKLDRTLYLLVRNQSKWEFPVGDIKDGEALHEAAMRGLGEKYGSEMNVWFVGRAPVGHLHGSDGSKIFFLKSHILSGQVKPEHGDFAWATKEELEKYVDKEYYESIKDCLADV